MLVIPQFSVSPCKRIFVYLVDDDDLPPPPPSFFMEKQVYSTTLGTHFFVHKISFLGI